LLFNNNNVLSSTFDLVFLILRSTRSPTTTITHPSSSRNIGVKFFFGKADRNNNIYRRLFKVFVLYGYILLLLQQQQQQQHSIKTKRGFIVLNNFRKLYTPWRPAVYYNIIRIPCAYGLCIVYNTIS